MEAPKLKCALCDQTFESEPERREHERAEHCAEVRPKRDAPSPDQEETAA